MKGVAGRYKNPRLYIEILCAAGAGIAPGPHPRSPPPPRYPASALEAGQRALILGSARLLPSADSAE